MSHKLPSTLESERIDTLMAFGGLLKIMDELREKCPWDKKQTLESLRHLSIEETYELSDAILKNNHKEIEKELGDLLLHIIFYAKIGSESGDFDMQTVIEKISEKLIHRHPHIYGDVKVENEEEVKANWEMLKLKEGNKSVLGGVPLSLPALVKAMRMQEKARGVGFDWEKPEQVWEKVEEELEEFREHIDPVRHTVKDKQKAEEEFGDLLFAMVNYARFLDINPETALERTNLKFKSRFEHVEKRAGENGQKLNEMSLADMEVYWEEAKKLSKTK
jgi:XTP/dITP diphosphohydrolase